MPIDVELYEITEAELANYAALLGEIESGADFDSTNQEHLDFLWKRIAAHQARGAKYVGCGVDSGIPLGVVGVVIDESLFGEKTAEILDIGIDPDRRRLGLGTALLDYAVNQAKKAGAKTIYARTYAADFKVIAFYGRNGFHPVAVVPDTNGQNDEGTIVMRKRINLDAPE
jgi:ribosomal protein S18 acetylase RimI-like enzyme